MRHRILLIINGSVILFVLVLLIAHVTSTPSTAQESFIQPEPAMEPQPATHLTYVVFEEAEIGSVMADTVAQPLDQDSQVKMVSAPETMSSQPEPVMCQTDGMVGSGNGRYLIRQYNCEANLYIQLQDTATPNTPPVVYARGYFLN